MKLSILLIIISTLGIVLNFIDYKLFLYFLSLIWYVASILIIYLAITLTTKYQGKQFSIKSFIQALKSKSKNDISPLSSLCVTLAAKIGVGSLSGVALAIYFGGLGTIFWMIVISLIVSINTYVECLLGMKYREKNDNKYVGGPSYYIKKCLRDKHLSTLYSILIIVSYSILFLSIQANTISNIGACLSTNNHYVVIILSLSVLFIISKGISIITKVNNKLVPGMLILYLFLGIYVTVSNYQALPSIFVTIIKSAFNIKSIIPVFLIGMQRAIFITESSLGTSAISASSCDNNPESQGMLEVLGIHITTFIVCLTTFIIIATSNYQLIGNNINGIEIVLYAFNYHFGRIGSILLSIITVMFAFSTIISSYYFGESNLIFLTKKRNITILYKIVFMIVIITSCYIKSRLLWNLTDYFVALIAIINVYSIIKIIKNTNTD